MNKRKRWLCLLFFCVILAGCSTTQKEEQAKKELETGFIPARAGMYDSADTAVIKQINRSKETIVFYNLVRERSYTLNYDGTTGLYDKYGSSVSMEQLKEGDIVDITFLKSKKMLASIQMSETSFCLDDVERFTINEKKQEITIGENTYRFEDELLIFSKGKQAELMDINQVDTLVVQGIDRTVYSIAIDKGHGYLRLKNDEYFWGGWIEVGQEIIRPIEEDMLLVVPEGKYEVVVSTKGITETKTVNIKRDRETELDLGDLKREDKKKFGTLLIAVRPDSAEVYIDGERADISEPCKVEYGIHQLMAKAEGYQTVIQYIKVGQESAGIEIVMEKETAGSVSSNSTGNTVSGNDTVTASGGKLTIDAPDKVEVYLDGSYVGITPVSFTKTVGIHVITLRAKGYETKSYTINIENTTTNESMSFSELVKVVEEEEDEEEDKDNEDDDDDDKKDDDDKDKEEKETSTQKTQEDNKVAKSKTENQEEKSSTAETENKEPASNDKTEEGASKEEDKPNTASEEDSVTDSSDSEDNPTG